MPPSDHLRDQAAREKLGTRSDPNTPDPNTPYRVSYMPCRNSIRVLFDTISAPCAHLGLRRSRKRAVGWVEPRLVAARPTTQAVAIGGPHDAEHRSTHPTTGCGSAALGSTLWIIFVPFRSDPGTPQGDHEGLSVAA